MTESLWHSADKQHTFRLVGDTLSIDTSLRSEGFHDGNLDIHLIDTPTQTLTGELAPSGSNVVRGGAGDDNLMGDANLNWAVRD